MKVKKRIYTGCLKKMLHLQLTACFNTSAAREMKKSYQATGCVLSFYYKYSLFFKVPPLAMIHLLIRWQKLATMLRSVLTSMN